jgi:hypothetical protein
MCIYYYFIMRDHQVVINLKFVFMQESFLH